MTLAALLDFLAEHVEEADRALRIHRQLEHRDDLIAELWLVHHALSAAADRTLDFADPLDRQALLHGWRRCMKLHGGREQRRARQTRSAHAPLHADAPGLQLLDLLPAPEASDPLEALDNLDALLSRLLAPAEFEGTWSQPAGYLHLFEAAGERLRELALLCGTGDAMLVARLRRLVELHRVQSRLFDGVHRLGVGDVAPPRGRPRHVRRPVEDTPQPLLWPEAIAGA